VAVSSLCPTSAGVNVLATSASAASASLLANPGLENGSLSGWACDAGTGSVVTSPVDSGSYALSGYTEGAYVYLGVTGGTDAWTPADPPSGRSPTHSRATMPPTRCSTRWGTACRRQVLPGRRRQAE
jgi:hypothetical protein